MILRPTAIAVWASGASGNVVEPIQADKNQGFLPTGIARSSYANWLWGVAGQWQNHLDRESRMDNLVADDFVRGIGPTTIAALPLSATSIGPLWRFGPSGAFALSPGLGNVDGAMGLVTISNIPNGQTASIDTNIGAPGAYDFRMTVRSAMAFRGVSGSSYEFGMPGICSFWATGASGILGFRFFPSGGSPTSVVLTGIDPTSGGTVQFRRYEVERVGPTMYVSIDSVVQKIMPGVAPSPTGAMIGAVVVPGTTGIGPNPIIDRIEFKVLRP